MAVIRVCDICGKKVPTLSCEHRSSVRYHIKREGLKTTGYDLCSDCMNKMIEWIKENTESEDE